MEENKTEIVWDLCKLLRKTRHGSDISMMEYVQKGYGEYVRITFEGGFQKDVDISADSGIAIIKDVINQPWKN